MSTTNFYAKCNKYFAIKSNESTDEFLGDDIIESVLSELEDFDPVNKWTNDLRGYKGKIFGSISKYYQTKDTEFGVRIDLIIRDGYFSGMNLDYDIVYLDATNEEDYQYLLDYAPKHIVDKIDKWVEKTCKRVEKAFRKNSDIELELVGVFSNGEGVYRKAKAHKS